MHRCREGAADERSIGRGAASQAVELLLLTEDVQGRERPERDATRHQSAVGLTLELAFRERVEQREESSRAPPGGHAVARQIRLRQQLLVHLQSLQPVGLRRRPLEEQRLGNGEAHGLRAEVDAER
jgi:hypothetical protein